MAWFTLGQVLGTFLTLIVPPLWAGLLALLIGPSPGRRAAVVVLGALGLIGPFLAPTDIAIAKGACANLVGAQFLMLLDLALGARVYGARQRVLRVVAFVDPSVAKPRTGAPDRRLLLRLLAFGTASGLMLWVALSAETPLLRWGAGLVLAYTAFEVLHASVVIPVQLLGIQLPSFHLDPILSRSVAEFWGERWNRVISGWLRAHCFRPLARRKKARLGIALAFVVSAALHAHIFWPAVGTRLALMVGLFFAIQPLFVLMERGLGLRRQPAWIGRAWTLGALALSSPLIIEPFLQAIQPR